MGSSQLQPIYSPTIGDSLMDNKQIALEIWNRIPDGLVHDFIEQDLGDKGSAQDYAEAATHIYLVILDILESRDLKTPGQ